MAPVCGNCSFGEKNGHFHHTSVLRHSSCQRSSFLRFPFCLSFVSGFQLLQRQWPCSAFASSGSSSSTSIPVGGNAWRADTEPAPALSWPSLLSWLHTLMESQRHTLSHCWLCGCWLLSDQSVLLANWLLGGGQASLESDAICINWMIGGRQSFSSLCSLLLLEGDLLLCLCLAGGGICWRLPGLLSVILLALHLQSLSFSHPDLGLSLWVRLYLLPFPCPRYSYLPVDLTLSQGSVWTMIGWPVNVISRPGINTDLYC